MTVIERMARAMCIAEGVDPEGVSYVGMKATTCLERRIPFARAALEALREPSEAMLWAHELPHIGPDEIRELWCAMIDAALKESVS